MSGITYRDAVKEDAGLVLTFIKALAEYEKLLDEVVATKELLEETMFGSNAKTFCVIAEHEGKPIGYAVCFYTYSTFLGRAGIYIEDIYVYEEFRGKGTGKGFFQYIANKAVYEKCSRVEWSVLLWNKTSIEFYERLGAKPMDEWMVYRLDRLAIGKLAG